MMCTLLQTDNHADSLSLNFYRPGSSFCCPANSVKPLKTTGYCSVGLLTPASRMCTLLNKLSQPWARCKHKPSVNCKTAHVCVHNAYQCTHLLNTVQHRTVLIVFPFTLQTVITTLCCRLLTKTCLYSVHLNDSEGQNEIFWMAKQMVKERQDITGSRAANEKIMHLMIQAPK